MFNINCHIFKAFFGISGVVITLHTLVLCKWGHFERAKPTYKYGESYEMKVFREVLDLSKEVQ